MTTTTRKPSDDRHEVQRCRVPEPAQRGADPGDQARRVALGAGRPGPCQDRACLVADAADRHDDLGVLGVVLDLGAQPLHVDVDQAGVAGVAVAPDLLEQHLAREDLPGLAGERDEQVELQRRQRERRRRRA